MPTLRNLLSTIASYLALLVIPGLYYLGEWLPPLRALDAYLAARPGLVTALAVLDGVTALAGIFLLAGTQLAVRVGDERVTRSHGSTGSRGIRFPHFKITSSFADIATLGELKDAFRRGVWWREPRWRRFNLMILGGVMLLYGLIGVFIVIFPAGVKLVFSLALLYITARIAREVAAAPYPEEADPGPGEP